MEPIILIGGGGHCVSCIDVIEQAGYHTIAGIIDLHRKVGETVLDYPILGCDDDIDMFARNTPDFFITVGQVKSAALRKRLFQMVIEAGGRLPTIISPLAYVSRHAEIGEGSIVMHHAIINAGARIGKNCIVNSTALIEHEVSIGDYCHISTGAVVNGQVSIGHEVFVGSQAIISNNVSISSETVIGAGSLVLKNILCRGIFFGKYL